jgi:hypothetical protein
MADLHLCDRPPGSAMTQRGLSAGPVFCSSHAIVSAANEFTGSQVGSQYRQAPGGIRPHRARVSAAKRHAGRLPALSGGGLGLYGMQEARVRSLYRHNTIERLSSAHKTTGSRLCRHVGCVVCIVITEHAVHDDYVTADGGNDHVPVHGLGARGSGNTCTSASINRADRGARQR